MVVTEGSNVTLKCAATGSPAPTITWRREGGEPISLPGGVEGNSFIHSFFFLIFFRHSTLIAGVQKEINK